MRGTTFPSGEIIRFGCVGVVATFTHFVILNLSVKLLAYHPATGNVIAFILAACITYVGQSYWVFKSHGQTRIGRLLRFSVSLAVGAVLNCFIMLLATSMLGLPYQVGFVASVLIVPACSYLLNKMWVFRSIAA